LDAARVLVCLEDLREAHELLPTETDLFFTRDRNSLTKAQALIAYANGRLEEARTQYENASLQWGRFGAPFEQGQCLLGAARCLQEAGRKSEADSRLNAARTLLSPSSTGWETRRVDGFLMTL
jgi:hypothetical protein